MGENVIPLSLSLVKLSRALEEYVFFFCFLRFYEFTVTVGYALVAHEVIWRNNGFLTRFNDFGAIKKSLGVLEKSHI